MIDDQLGRRTVMRKEIIDLTGTIKSVGESLTPFTKAGTIGEQKKFKYVIFEDDSGKETQVNNLEASVDFARFIRPGQTGHFVIFRGRKTNTFAALETEKTKSVDPGFYDKKRIRPFHAMMVCMHFIFICGLLTTVWICIVLLPISLAIHLYAIHLIKWARKNLALRGFTESNVIESF